MNYFRIRGPLSTEFVRCQVSGMSGRKKVNRPRVYRVCSTFIGTKILHLQETVGDSVYFCTFLTVIGQKKFVDDCNNISICVYI